MLCEKCGKSKATIMYTQIINGRKRSLNICTACASQESILDNFGSFLSFSTENTQEATSCPVCSTTLGEFMRSGRAGCGQCYSAFRKQAEAMLKKIHGSTLHNTETANLKKAETKGESELDSLRRRLTEAINEENFEEAALIRDKIRALEKEGK